MKSWANSVLAVIPARARSARIPHKNDRPLAGKPLVQWTIDAALGSEHITDIVVSTDSDRTAALCTTIDGVRWIQQPAELAMTGISATRVARAAIQTLGAQCAKAVVLLQPTSPFRDASVIDAAYELWSWQPGHNRRPLISVTSDPELNRVARSVTPNWLVTHKADIRHIVLSNGAIRINTAQNILTAPLCKEYDSAEGALPFVMDPTVGLDIDTPAEWAMAEYLAGQL